MSRQECRAEFEPIDSALAGWQQTDRGAPVLGVVWLPIRSRKIPLVALPYLASHDDSWGYTPNRQKKKKSSEDRGMAGSSLSPSSLSRPPLWVLDPPCEGRRGGKKESRLRSERKKDTCGTAYKRGEASGGREGGRRKPGIFQQKRSSRRLRAGYSF